MRQQCKSPPGFTLVEILVVVAILGVLAAIAISNYLGGLQKARQKRSMADIRSIAVAWEARAVDAHRYNAAGQTTPAPVPYTLPATTLSHAQLASMLTPTYIRVLPAIDGWSTPFTFHVHAPVGGTPSRSYAIRSAAADKSFEPTYVEGPTQDFDCDIIYSDGRYVVYPQVR